MKKTISLILIIIIALAGLAAWLVLGAGTAFSEKRQYLYIHSGQSEKIQVLETLKNKQLVKYPVILDFVGTKMNLWEKINPGRYEIKKGSSILDIIRMLRNNRQAPVNLVINKLRTNEDIAKIIGKNFEADSSEVMAFINNPDSLAKLGVDTNTVMTLIIPNTYNLYWNTPVDKIFQRLKSEMEKFWQENKRLAKAQEMALTPEQVYIIASIVEEETNKNDEKGNIASVYLNRYRIGMPLGADPTIKFALKDFSIKRIYNKHTAVNSPFNTYKNKGLPPGPICTPSSKSIDAVLNAPATDYLFFVAKSDFSGYHTFSSNFAEHLQHAKEYQKALDELMLKKQQKATDSL